MEKTYKYEDIEQILADANDLLQQIDPEIIEYLQEEQRAQLEQQVQSLKKLKSEVQDNIGKGGPSKSRPYSEGMHEAIDDIAKAVKALASYLS
jgi:CDGSH-type Zn-finger protein